MTLDTLWNELRSMSDVKLRMSMQKRYPKLTCLGIPLSKLRPFAKTLGHHDPFAKDLYASGIVEAMLLATMIHDPKTISRDQILAWSKAGCSTMIVDSGLSSLINSSPYANYMTKELYSNDDDDHRYTGFVLLSSYFRTHPLETMDITLGKRVLETIRKTIKDETLPIQNAMNNAVVMAGLHVPELVDLATEVASAIGHIMPLVRRNQCNIQSAYDYIIRYRTQPNYSRVAALKQIKP